MKNNLSQYAASSVPLLLLRIIPLIKRSARSLHITWFDFSALSRQVVWKSSSTAGFAPFVSNNMAASWNPAENNKIILKSTRMHSSRMRTARRLAVSGGGVHASLARGRFAFRLGRPHPQLWTDKREWKHYLPATPFVGGKNPNSLFRMPNNDIETDMDINKICTERNEYLHQSLYLSSMNNSTQFHTSHFFSVLMCASVNTPWMGNPAFFMSIVMRLRVK